MHVNHLEIKKLIKKIQPCIKLWYSVEFLQNFADILPEIYYQKFVAVSVWMSSYITNLVQFQSLIVSEIPTKLSFVGPAIPHSDFTFLKCIFVLVCQFLKKQNAGKEYICGLLVIFMMCIWVRE